MLPTKIVRFLGLAIVIIVLLSIVVIDQKGIMPLMESVANLIFIAIGALLTVAFGLLVFPQRFLGIGKAEKIELEDTKKATTLLEQTSIDKDDVELIEGIQIYLFFPIGTLEKNKTVDYHKKHLRYKLIVNFKTKPKPEAWYMSHPMSYGWKLLEKYPDFWIAVWYPAGTKSEDEELTAKWCGEKGFDLIPKDAEKEDLFKTKESVASRQKESIEKKSTQDIVHFKHQLLADLKQMRIRLNDVNTPMEIGFSTWANATHADFSLLGLEEKNDLKTFYSRLMKRNEELRSNGKSKKFVQINQGCLNTCVWLIEKRINWLENVGD